MEEQNGSGEYFVNLQDAARVRDFCLNTTTHKRENGAHEDHQICARCKSDLHDFKTLSISEKDGHLDMALLCLRAMNNPVFQRRSTADDDIPQWSESEETTNSKAEKRQEEEPSTTDPGTEEAESGKFADKETKEGEESNVPEEAESSMDAPEADTQADQSGYESDESMDDEDRFEVSVAPPVDKTEEVPVTSVEQIRKVRYEFSFWFDHMRRAEELWSPEERAKDSRWAELLGELDHFVSYNTGYFYSSQRFPNTDNTPTYHTDLKPLHLAAVYGLISWAEHLLANGADPNEKAGLPYPKTPVQMTAWHGNNVPMLQLLLEHGGDPNAGDENTYPAFHEWMYEQPSKEVIELFLKHGANTTKVDDICHWNVLHYFASNGNDVEALDLLLQESPDGKKPDINYSENSSPLHLLLLRREVPRILLQV